MGTNLGGDTAAQQPWTICSHPTALARSFQHIDVELAPMETRETFKSGVKCNIC